jgi:hypothetical protein
VTTRVVTMHVSCAPGGLVLDGSARATFDSLGDFELPRTPVGAHVVSAIGDPLQEIDPAARALFVDATENDRHWWGLVAVPTAGNLDVLMMPASTSCSLSGPGPADAGALQVARGGATFALVAAERMLVVGGGSGRPRSLVVHLDTGDVAPAQTDLVRPRSTATVTPFGSGALVAGGYDPTSPGAVFDDAEVYQGDVDAFDQRVGASIRLSGPRASHGAAVLATGETILVGGMAGADVSTVLGTMEIVNPVARTVRAEGVALLAKARSAPAVLRLASGEVLVAGGLDAQGAAVSTLEWFKPDASAPSRVPRDLVAGSARAFAALPGGGALAVVAPPAGAGPAFQSVWVIDADGALEAAVPIPGALTGPVLFGQAGGAPALWTGDRWLRWQPWDGAFGALGALDDVPADVSDVVASGDDGLAMWLDGATWAVTGLRFDTRGPYSSVDAPLLLTDASDLAPDRLPAAGVDAFDAALGGLVLAPGASAFITDRNYADVEVDVDAPTGEPALVVLRDGAGGEIEVGGAGCSGALSGTPLSSMAVRRVGSIITWNVPGVASGTCSAQVAGATRLAIGLRGVATASRSVARNLRVTRLGAP